MSLDQLSLSVTTLRVMSFESNSQLSCAPKSHYSHYFFGVSKFIKGHDLLVSFTSTT